MDETPTFVLAQHLRVKDRAHKRGDWIFSVDSGKVHGVVVSDDNQVMLWEPMEFDRETDIDVIEEQIVDAVWLLALSDLAKTVPGFKQQLQSIL